MYRNHKHVNLPGHSPDEMGGRKGKTKMDSGHGNLVMGGIPPARFSYHIILHLPLCLPFPFWGGNRGCRYCIASFPLPVSVGIISITTAISWTNMAIGILATRPHKHLQHSSSTWICCCNSSWLNNGLWDTWVCQGQDHRNWNIHQYGVFEEYSIP